MQSRILGRAAAPTGTPARHRLDRIFSFPAVLAGILVAKVFWTCRSTIADPDIWWHLRNAQFVITNRRFPNFDTYSFTAAGARWLDHEWLPDFVFLYAFRFLGLHGLFLVTFLCVAVLSVSVFLLCRVRTSDPLAAGLATIAGGVLGMVGFAPRPQLFGWLCFTAIFSILLLYRERRSAALWLIPLLFCLWINCHASWPFGVVVFSIVVAAGCLKEDIGPLSAHPWSPAELKKLLATLAASAAALFVNPFGYRLVWYPFEFWLSQKLNVGMVEEWASVNFNDSRGPYVMAVLAAVFLLALVPRQRWRIDDVLLTLLALYAGLSHIRMLLPAGIVLAPILAPQMTGISSYDPANERRVMNAVLLAGAAAFLVFAFPREAMLQEQLTQSFPVNATQFLRQHPPDGRIFNFYEWGGYLEWELPQMKTFIDSRADIFEDKGVLRNYVRISMLADSEELLDGYAIRYVLYAPNTALAYFLRKSADWQEIYRDSNAVIFRRITRDAPDSASGRD